MIKKETQALNKLIAELTIKVQEIAAQAVKTDGWMVPTEDDILLPFADYKQKEIEGWEQTDQYGILWRRRMFNLVKDKFDATGIFSSEDLDLVCAVLGALTPVFWEEWVSGHKLYDFWKKHQPKKAKCRKGVKHV